MFKDTTFTIPVTADHKDRKENLEIVLEFLDYFDTNILIGENKTNEFKYGQYDYMKFDYEHFHRTKMLNEMAAKVTTPYIANWDADVVVSRKQLLEAVERLRNGAGMVYPYEYCFARVERKDILGFYPYFAKVKRRQGTKEKPSYGGAVLWNKEEFFRIGGENEKFISFGHEDVERFDRAKKMGVKIERVEGEIYHFEHWRGKDSSTKNPFWKRNKEIYLEQKEKT